MVLFLILLDIAFFKDWTDALTQFVGSEQETLLKLTKVTQIYRFSTRITNQLCVTKVFFIRRTNNDNYFWINFVYFVLNGDNMRGNKFCLLKVRKCRFENLSSRENNMPKILHNNTFHFLRYAHMIYAKCLFTNIQKQ